MAPLRAVRPPHPRRSGPPPRRMHAHARRGRLRGIPPRRPPRLRRAGSAGVAPCEPRRLLCRHPRPPPFPSRPVDAAPRSSITMGRRSPCLLVRGLAPVDHALPSGVAPVHRRLRRRMDHVRPRSPRGILRKRARPEPMAPVCRRTPTGTSPARGTGRPAHPRRAASGCRRLDYASTGRMTSPWTSDRRKSRPPNRNVRRSWSIPRACNTVAHRSCTVQTSCTAW